MGTEARIERGTEHVGGHALFDRGHDRPTAFARVRDATGEVFQLGIFDHGNGDEVEQPALHHTAAAPQLGDLTEGEFVVEVVAHAGRRLGIMRYGLRVDIGIFEDVKALGQRGHHAVFHAVVDHLDEVPCAGRSAMQIAVLCRASELLPARRARKVAASGGNRFENRVEVPHGFRLPADHQAVAAFQAPHATARAAVDVMDALGLEVARAPAVIAEVRIPAVDDDVVFLQMRHECLDDLVRHSGRNHNPRSAGLFQFCGEFLERGGADRTVFDQRRHGVRMCVIDNASVSVPHEAPHDVGAHASESDHSKLHKLFSSEQGEGSRQ